MLSVLRVYDPADCDATGVPLDWERCRTCNVDSDGTPIYPDGEGGAGCPTCGGHGSLKAAALAERWRDLKRPTPDFPLPPVRCEGCGHPMSDGTWVNRDGREQSGDNPVHAAQKGVERRALIALRAGGEPDDRVMFWSPCDGGCRHQAPCRAMTTEGWRPFDINYEAAVAVDTLGAGNVEASWRAVDVRVGMLAKRAGLDVTTAGPLVVRPFDLRPENVAVLCLRCWAERIPACPRT